MPGGEAPVHGGLPAAGVARVHHVVVHEGAGVQQLKRGGGREDLAAIGTAACPPSPVAEPGPQPLAAGQQVIDRVHAREQVGADPPQVLALPSDERGQRGADLRPDPWHLRRANRHDRDLSRSLPVHCTPTGFPRSGG